MPRRIVVLLLVLLAAFLIAVAVGVWSVAGGTGGPGTPSADVTGRSDATGVEPPRVAFLGDSLTVGIGAPAGEGYAWRTAELLGWPVATVDGVSGSGYLAPGLGEPMPARVDDVVASDPDVVVVVGGNNDVFRGYDPGLVAEAARGLVVALDDGLPEAEVVVVGPFPNLVDDAPARTAMTAAIRGAAEGAGATWLDPEDLLAGTLDAPGVWEQNLSEDGLHPNAAGYRLIAEALAPRLAETVGAGMPR